MIFKGNGNKRQARILVADNDATIVLALSAILEEQGYQVATAFSGEEAVLTAGIFSPDLLVSDVWMGGINGFEAATRITAKLPECSVLFLSGLASFSEVLNAAPKRLVYSFTSKPVHPLDFLNAVAYMLSGVSTVYSLAGTSVGHGATQRYSLGRMPAKAGFILGKTGNEIGLLPEARSQLKAVFFDLEPQARTGLEMPLQ